MTPQKLPLHEVFRHLTEQLGWNRDATGELIYELGYDYGMDCEEQERVEFCEVGEVLWVRVFAMDGTWAKLDRHWYDKNTSCFISQTITMETSIEEWEEEDV